MKRLVYRLLDHTRKKSVYWLYNVFSYGAYFVLWLRYGLGLGRSIETNQLWRQMRGLVQTLPKRGVWVHCASLGEINAISTLVKAIKKHNDSSEIIISVFNIVDIHTIAQRFPRDRVIPFPFDCPGFAARVLDKTNPKMVVFAEGEIWPNFLSACRARSIAVHLVNAKMSARSYRRWLWLPTVFRREVLSSYDSIQAQGEVDYQRFIRLGASVDKVSVFGYLRWSYQPEQKLIDSGKTLAKSIDRPLWLAASVHRKEIGTILGIHLRLRFQMPDVLLVLAPRYPTLDGAYIEHELTIRGINYNKLEEDQAIDEANPEWWVKPENSVLWVQRMGELIRWYSFADLALICGSIDDLGGHNPIEAAVAHCAIFSGPNVENFKEIYQSFIDNHACVIHEDAKVLSELMYKSLESEKIRDTLTQNAYECVLRNRNEVEKIVERLYGRDI